MYSGFKNFIVFVISLIIFVPFSFAGELDYQPRGDRWEGIKPRPVSSSKVELLSALAYCGKESNITPDSFKLKFYLPEPSKVDIMVQELETREFYWMDKIKDGTLWQKGFNSYEWNTIEVIKPLKLKIYDLGVVIRLEKKDNNEIEQVVPGIFYHSTLPSKIKGYMFTFKTSEGAKLDYVIFKEGEKNPIKNEPLSRQPAGEPFVVFWDSSREPEGFYELIVKGYFLSDYVPIHHPVKFYHQPTIK